MRVVIQRVNKAQVAIDNEVVGKIKRGFLLLVGLRDGDELEQVKKAADKIVMTRIYKGRNLLYRLGVVRIYKRRKLEFIPSIYVYI